MSTNQSFSPDLLSKDVAASLPEGYSMRPLQRDDHSAGFLDVLRVLTTVGDVDGPAFEQQFDAMRAAAGSYHVLVILDGKGRIVGTGALIVERKLQVQSSPQVAIRAAGLPFACFASC